MKLLEKVRVLDLSRVLAGPWASQLLADLGAEVIKVERPGTGDDTRLWGPPDLKDGDGRSTGESAYYLCANRGKRSVAVDMASTEGQALIRDIAAESDIVIENFKVGGLARYGLDYAALSAVNTGLIYCSITGFGQTGPYAGRPGYDFVIQGMSGLMSVTGEAAGYPTKVGIPLADLATGLYAAVGILGALHRRSQTGQGGYIDMALLDVMLSLMANQSMNYLTTGEAPVRMGNAHPNIVPYQAFPTRDGMMVLAAGNDRQFAAFCRVAGREDLARDARFATNSDRVVNRMVLVPHLEKLMSERTTNDWVTALVAAGVPAGPVYDLHAAFTDPQVLARGMRVEAPHPLAGHTDLVRCPIRMADGAGVDSLDSAAQDEVKAPPLLGEDTRQILREHGLSDSAIDDLIARGIVAVSAKEK